MGSTDRPDRPGSGLADGRLPCMLDLNKGRSRKYCSIYDSDNIFILLSCYIIKHGWLKVTLCWKRSNVITKKNLNLDLKNAF